MGRVVDLGEAARLRAEARAAGRRVVLTNGYFDVLHVGHTRSLRKARDLGDLLVVAVNADATAQRAKGPRRPINPEGERAELLAALACVDYVVIFHENTAERVVSILQPDIYAKGGDYDPATLPEAPIVQAYGGRVVLMQFEPGHSTTDVVDRIVQRYGGGKPSTPPLPNPSLRSR